MTESERTLLYKLYGNATRLLQFGVGGSMVAALGFENIQKVHAVDSSLRWVMALKHRDDVAAAKEDGRLELIFSDIGTIGTWGYPKKPKTKPIYKKTATMPMGGDSLDTLKVVDRAAMVRRAHEV